ncbi:hypothetical protein TrLO_g11615 [Triparma laevis f. longispina]|uniref:BZIP domain-containing protein n=2 Tax=Triparma laevis TaxID=1534972 RepID=A0A9W7F9R6_9STRA|nr:hypothetical protein TrLO_g11615 [Triparma laevis f. longispina]
MSTSVKKASVQTFSSASANKAQNPSGKQDENLDFDLLAEYLMDDGDPKNAPSAFEMGMGIFGDNDLVPDKQPASSEASSEDGQLFAPSNNALLENTFDSFQAPLMSPPAIPQPVEQPAVSKQPQTSSRSRSRSTAAKKRKASAAQPDTSTSTSTSSSSRPKSKSQAQIDRRRERNRILARRTRLRKKFFFESLQKDVADLQTQNERLRGIIRTRLPKTLSTQILTSCAAKLPDIVADNPEMNPNVTNEDKSLVRSLRTAQQCFCISDPSLPDNPIVYATGGFCDLTGYALSEILGRNCRFLQGPGTSLKKVEKLRAAISRGEDCQVCLLNYKSDGTPFYNQLFVAALKDASNSIVNYVGVQSEVSLPPPEDEEHEAAKAIQAAKETEDGSLLGGSVGELGGADDFDSFLS